MGCNCSKTRQKLLTEVRRGDLGEAAKTARRGLADIAAHAGRKLKPPKILKRR